MGAATFNQIARLDPTNSLLFKGAMFLQLIPAKLKRRTLVEVTRLLLLGFYEDFLIFLNAVDQAELQAPGETEFKEVWAYRVRAAESVARLVDRLESTGYVPYKGRRLIDFLLGGDRVQALKLFVQATIFENQGEKRLDRAKRDFLATVVKRRLTKNQEAALLEKYKELSQVPPPSPETTSGT